MGRNGPSQGMLLDVISYTLNVMCVFLCVVCTTVTKTQPSLPKHKPHNHNHLSVVGLQVV